MVFCDFYLPGYKSGGGMWTVVNLVDRFCDQYDFYVVTRNYDSKGDTKPFTSVVTDDWNRTGNAEVFYASKKNLSPNFFAALVEQVKPDAVFLNSALSTPVIRYLQARRKKLFAEIPTILAPCGEMSKGALSVKPFKKKIFLKYAKTVNLYQNIIWKASFESEMNEIKQMMGRETEILIAPDLAPKTILEDYAPVWKPRKEKGAVKLVFMSRLVPKKNIHYILERLRSITEGAVNLDIVGPLEDQAYWQKCLSIIETLPQNVRVNATGAFPEQHDALKKVAESHFFVLPTLNENFGYVFIEGLAAGCPLLISEQTVWDDIEANRAGWSIPLKDTRGWIDRLKYCIEMEDEEYRSMSEAARRYSENWLNDPKFDEATARVLERALHQKARIASR